jgi:hypothetical protein
MNVYGYRIINDNPKFPGLLVAYIPRHREGFIDLAALEAPSLLLCHAHDQLHVNSLSKELRKKPPGSLAILFLGQRFNKPEGATEFVHCLSYSVETPCDDPQIRDWFENLVAVAKRQTGWRAEEMEGFWRIVDQDHPETLLAWYLVQLAKERGVVIDGSALPDDFNTIAASEFSRYGGAGLLELAAAKTLLMKIYRRTA